VEADGRDGYATGAPMTGTVHVDGPVGLVGLPASWPIIDVAGGAQPIFNEDRSKAVIFNGEIYNFAPSPNA